MDLITTPLVDALQRIAQANQVMTVYTVVIDTLNAETAKFYRNSVPPPPLLPSQPLKLFLPMDTRSRYLRRTHNVQPAGESADGGGVSPYRPLCAVPADQGGPHR